MGQCSTCKHSVRVPTPPGAPPGSPASALQCNRYPPQSSALVVGARAHFDGQHHPVVQVVVTRPQVGEEDSCGEFVSALLNGVANVP